jgi:hypothetical protein
MAGTASSLAGTFRFGIGAIIGALLSMATFTTAWPMLISIAFCATSSILFYLYASRRRKSHAKTFQGRNRPFLMHINQMGFGSAICFFYVKSISVKSHIIAIKKLS